MFPEYRAVQPQKHALTASCHGQDLRAAQKNAKSGRHASLSVENNEDCNVFYRHVQIHIRFAQRVNNLGATPENQK
jgi:hypothetical protein